MVAVWNSVIYDINGHVASTDAPVGASDYLLIYDDSNGDQRKILFDNAAKSSKSIILTAAGAWPSATSGAAKSTRIELSTNKQNVYVCDFDKNSDEYIQWQICMPDSYDGGTLTARFMWTANSTSTNSAVWGIQGYCYGDGEALDATWGTAVTVTDANHNVAHTLNISASTAAITLGGTPVGGEFAMIRVYRDANAVADDLAVDARFLAAILEYGVNKWSD